MPTGEDRETKALKPLPRDVENVADDPSLHNPLARQERLSTGWFGVVVEFDGVVVEDTSDLHTKAWLQLADEEGKSRPLQFALKRAEGMKNEQVVQEVFCWSRNPMEVRRLCARKEELYAALAGNHKPPVVPGVPLFLETLVKHNVPAGVVSAAPEARMRSALAATGLEHAFQTVVTGDDVYRGRPDPEAYLFAAQQLGRPTVRCVVVGNSNQSVEAARECGMRAVVVAGRKPLYELGAADLVVRGLDELSFINLKQLFSDEESVEAHSDEPELEPELEEEEVFSRPTMTMDYWPQ
ncbi:g6039 [Coccomyxa elongata]